eukprot:scaffold8762_cov114-Isochrysis_galbana.AAC.5
MSPGVVVWWLGRPPHLSSLVCPLPFASLVTRLSDTTSAAARVVGTPNAAMASEARNSRTVDRSTFRPSAAREKGVWPAPLSWTSHRPRASVGNGAIRTAAAPPAPSSDPASSLWRTAALAGGSSRRPSLAPPRAPPARVRAGMAPSLPDSGCACSSASSRTTISPSEMTAPSPNWPAKRPNW